MLELDVLCISGLLMLEPATAITDFVLAYVCFHLLYKLLRNIKNEQRSVLYWSISFFFIGFAALMGGINHGYVPFQHGFRQTLGVTVMVCIGMAQYCLLTASVYVIAVPKWKKYLLIANTAAISLYTMLLMFTHSFSVVVIYFIASHVLLLAIFAIRILSYEEQHSHYILLGLTLGIVGGIIQQGGSQIDLLLNTNAIYHLIQAGAMFLLYAGGKHLKDNMAHY